MKEGFSLHLLLPYVKRKLATENLSEAGESQVHMNEKPFLLCCFNYLY